MSEMSLSIPGTPAPWGSGVNRKGSPERLWRQRLRDGATESVGRPRQVPPETHFDVDITFQMSPSHIERSDLDNLAKPVLDTLFKIRYAQVSDRSLTGVMFDNVDDDRVFSLRLRKEPVPDPRHEGALIIIKWT